MTVMNESVSNQAQGAKEIEEPAHAADGEVEPVGADGLEAVAAGTPLAESFNEKRAVPEPNLTHLRSATEATYGAPTLQPEAESIIGDDGRVKIEGTANYPWRATASLLITARDGTNWIGTAFFIGPRVLATAGHNIFFQGTNTARRGWARSIRVTPGQNGADQPYGNATSSRFFSVRGWTTSGDPEFDYGVIVLDADDDLGSQTGWLGFGSYSDETLRSTTGHLTGYPADKGGDEQWYMARTIDSVSGRQVFYDIDTFGGHSGSAVYRIADGQRRAVGIHAYGVGSRPLNAATRINREVFDNLLSWKNANT